MTWYTALNVVSATRQSNFATKPEKATRSQIIRLVKELCSTEWSTNAQPTAEDVFSSIRDPQEKSKATTQQYKRPDNSKWGFIGFLNSTTNAFDTNLATLTVANTQRGSFFKNSSYYYIPTSEPSTTAVESINSDPTNWSTTQPRTENAPDAISYNYQFEVVSKKLSVTPSYIVLQAPFNATTSTEKYMPEDRSLYMVLSFEYPGTITQAAGKPAVTPPKKTILRGETTYSYGLKKWSTTYEIDTTQTNSLCVYFIVGDKTLDLTASNPVDKLGLYPDRIGNWHIVNGSLLPSLVGPSGQMKSLDSSAVTSSAPDLVWTYQLNMPYTQDTNVTEGTPKIHYSINDEGFFWMTTSGLAGKDFDFCLAVLSKETGHRTLGGFSYGDSQGPSGSPITTFVGTATDLLNINRNTGIGLLPSGRKTPFETGWPKKISYPMTGSLNSKFITYNYNPSSNKNDTTMYPIYQYWVLSAPLQFGSLDTEKSKGTYLNSVPEQLSTDTLTSNLNTSDVDSVDAIGADESRAYNTMPLFFFDWSDTILEIVAGSPIRQSFGLTGNLNDFYWGSNKIPPGTVNVSKSGVGHVAVGCFWFPVRTLTQAIYF